MAGRHGSSMRFQFSPPRLRALEAALLEIEGTAEDEEAAGWGSSLGRLAEQAGTKATEVELSMADAIAELRQERGKRKDAGVGR